MASKRAGLLLLALGIAACGSSVQAVKTTSSPKQPAWMARAPKDADALYFTGAKEGSSTLDEGKASAMAAARDQAAQFIGVEISAEHNDVMSTEAAENKASDKIRSRAQAVIRSAELADVYYERISREAGSGTVDRYDVWVLLKLPKAEIANERKRQDDEAKQAATSALARLREAQSQEKQGHLLAALARYRDVVSQMKPLAANVATGDAELATSGRLRQVAEDAAAQVQGRARRAVVVAPDWVAGSVMQALSARGFSASSAASSDPAAALAQARAGGMPWVIIVKATSTPGGKVFSQVAANASLDVRALDVQSGAVVASSQKQAKGVGRTPEAAQQAAASEAGVNAGNELAAALVAKENTGL